MSEHREETFTKALELRPVERAELVENLLANFELPSRKATDVLWAQEAESRINAFEWGEIAAIPVKDVFEEIEKQKE